MFPFSQPSLSKFKPKEAKFSQLYKSRAKRNLSSSAKTAIKGALKSAGVGQAKINRIINQDRPAKIQELKILAEKLNKGKVKGFEASPGRVIENYVRQEAVKQRNVAQVRHQYMLEAGLEQLTNPNRPAPKTGGKVGLPF